MLCVLETRNKIHFSESSMTPACRSRAQVDGFRFVAGGNLSLPAGARRRLCQRCIEALDLEIEIPHTPEGAC